MVDEVTEVGECLEVIHVVRIAVADEVMEVGEGLELVDVVKVGRLYFVNPQPESSYLEMTSHSDW